MELQGQKDVKIVFDVLVSDPLKVDLYVYSLWIQGLPGTSQFLLSHQPKHFRKFDSNHNVVVADVAKRRAASSPKALSDDQLALLFRDTQVIFRAF